jgi:ATP-dependent exoDNAse (exonuclease V) alpha subunit
VDGVILSADAMKQELFYVGASRGRSETSVIALKPATCGQFKTGHFGWPET